MVVSIVGARRGVVAVLVGLTFSLGGMLWASAAEAGKGWHRQVPVIFVHGGSGSAQQFETNAMRFTSNGYPHSSLHAYEYDTSGPTNDAAVAGLDGFIAEVRGRTGADRVDILAHSRGTTVMHAYLSTPERAAQVRKYVNFDGRTAAAPPGGVPTLAIWGEGDQTRAIAGAENVYYPDKAHTEVTTSREAFADVFRFLTSRPPWFRDVVPEPPWRVTVAGRSALFPANIGYEGAVLRVYEVWHHSGRRKSRRPLHEVTLGPDGNFGPLRVDGRKRYEFEVSSEGVPTIHNYPEPFERDDHFYRVFRAPALAPFIELAPEHSVLTVTRMREWWGDQPEPAANDRLELNGLDVLNPAIAPRARRIIAVFDFDRGSDGVTDMSAPLFPFSALSFLTGVDLYLPANPDASGTVTVKETVRGSGHNESLNVPNWPSDGHAISVYFKDYVARAFPGWWWGRGR